MGSIVFIRMTAPDFGQSNTMRQDREIDAAAHTLRLSDLAQPFLTTAQASSVVSAGRRRTLVNTTERASQHSKTRPFVWLRRGRYSRGMSTEELAKSIQFLVARRAG